MKVKTIGEINTCTLDKQINEFIKGKHVIDIKFSSFFDEDEKLKHELKNSLDKILTINKIKDIESITYEGSNIVATSDPAYFDISIRIKGHLEEKKA